MRISIIEGFNSSAMGICYNCGMKLEEHKRYKLCSLTLFRIICARISGNGKY